MMCASGERPAFYLEEMVEELQLCWELTETEFTLFLGGVCVCV